MSVSFDFDSMEVLVWLDGSHQIFICIPTNRQIHLFHLRSPKSFDCSQFHVKVRLDLDSADRQTAFSNMMGK
jgi:hypothetical protein